MLICKFASPRSDERKIRNWINYLEGLEQKHANDTSSRQVIEYFLTEAKGWRQDSVEGGR